ncbi:putative lipid II flippase FtsW [Spirochaeta dissipatitropha]
MSSIFALETVPGRRSDRALLMCTLLLTGVGLAMLFSVSYSRADILFQNPFHFVKRQSIMLAAGLAGALVLARIDLKIVEKLSPFASMAGILLLLLTLVPFFGETYLGAQRWIVLFGHSFQPSELTKITMTVHLAFLLGRKQSRLDDVKNTILPPLFIAFIVPMIIVLQNDFSTSILVLVIAISIFFLAGVKIRYFISVLIMSIPTIGIVVLSKEHRVNRIISFLAPDLDPQGAGYQVLMSRSALQTGGFWGQGIGMGRYKFGLLPEAHSDFIFAIVGEELGFLGVLLVLILFLYLAYRGYLIARDADDGFVRLCAAGLTISILFQALMNMAVVSGTIPATGITLPFFSSGGTSAMVTLWMCGLLINLSRNMVYERTEGGLRG